MQQASFAASDGQQVFSAGVHKRSHDPPPHVNAPPGKEESPPLLLVPPFGSKNDGPRQCNGGGGGRQGICSEVISLGAPLGASAVDQAILHSQSAAQYLLLIREGLVRLQCSLGARNPLSNHWAPPLLDPIRPHKYRCGWKAGQEIRSSGTRITAQGHTQHTSKPRTPQCWSSGDYGGLWCTVACANMIYDLSCVTGVGCIRVWRVTHAHLPTVLCDPAHKPRMWAGAHHIVVSGTPACLWLPSPATQARISSIMRPSCRVLGVGVLCTGGDCHVSIPQGALHLRSLETQNLNSPNKNGYYCRESQAFQNYDYLSCDPLM